MPESMRDATLRWRRLDALKNLALVLADAIDEADGQHSMAQLARQYRETIAEIESIEGVGGDDELAKALGLDGDANAVRPRRAAV